MPDITLTQLLDVVSKAGTPKANCVKNIKAQLAQPYSPTNDFYKIIREGIVEAHERNFGKQHIKIVAATVNDHRRAAHYSEIAKEYVGWWGPRSITWFAPPHSTWTPPGSTFGGVVVNPEVGLVINGQQHVVKLYFKEERLSKPRVDIITHLMHDEFSAALPHASFSVLDVRRRRLHTVTPPTGLRSVLIAEHAYIVALWPFV